LPGNALAVAADFSNPQCSIIVSVDSIHKPGSTTSCRSEAGDVLNPLYSFKFQGHELHEASTFKLADDDESQSAALTNLLYPLENLRKRDGEEKDDE
jgi:tRNA (guanine-N(7)-)-methyltransferase subunit TRM82